MNQKTVSETARIAAMETTHPSGDPRFADLDRIIESYNHESTALIQVLHAAQQMFGYLGADVLAYVETLKLHRATTEEDKKKVIAAGGLRSGAGRG